MYTRSKSWAKRRCAVAAAAGVKASNLSFRFFFSFLRSLLPHLPINAVHDDLRSRFTAPRHYLRARALAYIYGAHLFAKAQFPIPLAPPAPPRRQLMPVTVVRPYTEAQVHNIYIYTKHTARRNSLWTRVPYTKAAEYIYVCNRFVFVTFPRGHRVIMAVGIGKR